FALITVMIVLTGLGCKKSSTPPPPEEDLKISIDAASYTLTPGPDFSFNLKVESAMPIRGVAIHYTVKGEFDNQNYPQGPTINTLPRQKICICTVTVTSKSKNTNTATTSFRVGYK